MEVLSDRTKKMGFECLVWAIDTWYRHGMARQSTVYSVVYGRVQCMAWQGMVWCIVLY